MNKNSIYGAIIGDIAGSHLEVAEIVAKQNQTIWDIAKEMNISEEMILYAKYIFQKL